MDNQRNITSAMHVNITRQSLVLLYLAMSAQGGIITKLYTFHSTVNKLSIGTTQQDYYCTSTTWYHKPKNKTKRLYITPSVCSVNWVINMTCYCITIVIFSTRNTFNVLTDDGTIFEERHEEVGRSVVHFVHLELHGVSFLHVCRWCNSLACVNAT